MIAHSRLRAILILLAPALPLVLFGWAVMALPIMLFPFFPTQDGPAHLNTGLTLAALMGEPDLFFHRYFELRAIPPANQLASRLIAFFARTQLDVDPEKATWLAIFAAFAITATVNLAVLKTRALAFAPLFFVVMFGWLTNMGYMNFLVGMTLFLQAAFLIQYGLRRPSMAWMLASGMLAVLTYLAHPLAGLALGASAGAVAVGYLVLFAVSVSVSVSVSSRGRVLTVEGPFSWRLPLGCAFVCGLLLALAAHDALPQIARFFPKPQGNGPAHRPVRSPKTGRFAAW